MAPSSGLNTSRPTCLTSSCLVLQMCCLPRGHHGCVPHVLDLPSAWFGDAPSLEAMLKQQHLVSPTQNHQLCVETPVCPFVSSLPPLSACPGLQLLIPWCLKLSMCWTKVCRMPEVVPSHLSIFGSCMSPNLYLLFLPLPDDQKPLKEFLESPTPPLPA